MIIVVGLFLARILAGLVGSSTGEAGYAQTIVKYAIIALFTAIGLTFMGLADQIVMMAFGLILGSAAIATALAFGLGGRDAAARILERWAEGQAPAAAAGLRRGSSAPPRRPRTTASRRWCDSELDRAVRLLGQRHGLRPRAPRRRSIDLLRRADGAHSRQADRLSGQGAGSFAVSVAARSKRSC